MQPTALLTGVRVLDLSHVLAGPYCAALLATLGAEVIKLEHPRRGDLSRSLGNVAELNERGLGTAFLSMNASKRCIAVDFKTPRGADIVRELARRSDVVIESFRAGALDALDLGHERLMADNPRLIYCAVSGFGQDGPLRGVRAFDQIMQAASGIMASTGEPEGPPMKAGMPVTDNATGQCAAFAVASALFAREHTGRGCFIDVSMLESSYSLMASQATETLITGEPPPRLGNGAFTRAPSSDCFQTGDGQLLVGANTDAMCERLLRTLGLEDMLGDPRFATLDARRQHADAFRQQVETALNSAPADEWVARLAPAGVPCSRVHDLASSLGMPVNAERGVARDHPYDGPGGQVPLLGAPFRIDGRRPGPAFAPRHHGADTREVLAGIGITGQDIETLFADGVVA